MSGPCTDCGGPDYQTLVARIAELEALSNTSICIFCGTTMDKDLNVMLDHAKGCEKRPENELMRRIDELEAMLLLAAEKHAGRCPCGDHEQDRIDYLADLRARAEEGSTP